MRHSGASRIAVGLQVRNNLLVLSIHDDGVGFDAGKVLSAPANVASGIGLRSLREATEELGGRMSVESGPDGTKLVVTVAPFPEDS